MGLLYDLYNLSLELVNTENIELLNKRGAYPIIRSGEIVGFEDSDGVPLVMY